MNRNHKMNIKTVIKNNNTIAVITSEEKRITDVQSALDLIMTAKYEAQTDKIVINKEAIADEFFILSSGLAGEILQKMINYGVKLAIFGDYSGYTSKPLKDLIRESNQGKDLFFMGREEEAVEKLSGL